MQSSPRSSDSKISIGFVDNRNAEKNVIPSCPMVKTPSMDNMCCLLLYCKVHKRLALTKKTKGLFFPYITFQSNESWLNLVKLLLNHYCERACCSEVDVFDIFRVQWPETRQFYTRITMLVKLESETLDTSNTITGTQDTSDSKKSSNKDTTKKKTGVINCYCRAKTSSTIWMNVDELANNTGKFLGPEVLNFNRKLQESDPVLLELMKNYADCSVRNSLKLHNISCNERKLLQDAKYTKQVAIKLYNEFVVHCFPSRWMNFSSFKSFMCKLNWSQDDNYLRRIFKTLNYKRTNYLSFEGKACII